MTADTIASIWAIVAAAASLGLILWANHDHARKVRAAAEDPQLQALATDADDMEGIG